jgi:hypothetical protein
MRFVVTQPGGYVNPHNHCGAAHLGNRTTETMLACFKHAVTTALDIVNGHAASDAVLNPHIYAKGAMLRAPRASKPKL